MVDKSMWGKPLPEGHPDREITNCAGQKLIGYDNIGRCVWKTDFRNPKEFQYLVDECYKLVCSWSNIKPDMEYHRKFWGDSIQKNYERKKETPLWVKALVVIGGVGLAIGYCLLFGNL